MNHLKSIIKLFLKVSLYICITGYLNACIINKESYKIQPDVKYKNDLNIAILPFSGQIPEERKYTKDLVRNYLSDKIFAYKKIRFDPAVNFKTYNFSNSDKEIKTDDNAGKESNDVFLNLRSAEENEINTIEKILGSSSEELPAIPGADIVISGKITQSTAGIKVNLTVLNYIFGKVFNIERNGSFKYIDQLMDELFQELIKSIIVNYSYLVVSSTEKNVRIYADDRYFGRTDSKEIILEAGIHKVIVYGENEAGKKFDIVLAKGAAEKLFVDFHKEQSQIKYSLKITTLPENAKVHLDSAFIGNSPVFKNDLTAGTYRLRIEKDGFITKYATITFGDDKERNQELLITLEEGNTQLEYFTRTTAYNKLFKSSFIGAAISSASYIYFGMKINDENSDLNTLSPTDPKRHNIEKRRDNYTMYRQISLYTLGAMVISTGLFYYLDIKQDDIAVALYTPQINSFSNYASFTNPAFSFSSCKNIGIAITKSF